MGLNHKIGADRGVGRGDDGRKLVWRRCPSRGLGYITRRGAPREKRWHGKRGNNVARDFARFGRWDRWNGESLPRIVGCGGE